MYAEQRERLAKWKGVDTIYARHPSPIVTRHYLMAIAALVGPVNGII